MKSPSPNRHACSAHLGLGVNLACLGALLAGCSVRQGFQAGDDCCGPNAPAPAGQVVAGPLYESTTTWYADGGAKLRLADLRGRPRVMAMFFTNCQGVCLLTVEHMQQVQASLPAEVRGKVGFVLVTLDPARDTAEKLVVYRRENVLPAKSWTILRGDDNATAELAARLGITFERDSSRGFVHSSGITLVDSDGNVIQQQLGNHPDLAAMVQALEAAVNKETVAASRSAE